MRDKTKHETMTRNTHTELPDHYDPDAVEQHAKQHWSEVDAHTLSNERNADGEPFYFVDGPPYTSGRMHCGTAWGKVLKDALLRYHRMQGQEVVARPGYDTHGLPVERRVEEKHGFESKQDVEEFGVDRFAEECRQYVEEQRTVMDEEFANLGVWMDWDDPYQTMDVEYMDAVWAAFAELHDLGLVERGRRVVNTCPDCETSVAETLLSYESREAREAYVGFPLVDEDAYLVTWTTTPWTVVGNQFVAVDEDAEYAAVKTDERRLYAAAERVEDVAASVGWDDYEVEERVRGSALVGRQYRNPLEDALSDDSLSRTGRVEHADYVDTEGDGTGLVHSAPGFGQEDFERGRELGLPAYAPVDETGTFTEAVGTYAGMGVREAVPGVLDDLEVEDALLVAKFHTHEYPHCPRCDEQILYRAAEQWVVRVTEFKDDLLDAVEETEWYPADARENRFRRMVEESPDWNVSRQRYWGTPVPVWTCGDCGSDRAVGGREELATVANLDESPSDLHRSTVDALGVECPECGGACEREEDVLDVWFDSAVASWATAGVSPPDAPEGWPADLVVEGHDQTRGWFLVQLYLGVALEGRAPYEEVLMHGFAQLDGEAMSKSRGHVLRPPTVVEEHGRDPLRARLLSHNPQASDVNLSSDLDGVAALRDRFDVVWNVYRFALLYMELDGHTPVADVKTAAEERNALDNWVLSRLQATVEAATEAMEARRTDLALNAVLDFLVEDVSRYYVKAVRDRVWHGDAGAYDVLGTVMHESARLLAPFAPHLAEQLHAALGGDERTVHAERWPEADASMRDRSLEDEMAVVREVEESAASARHRTGRKRRWPVAEVVVEADDAEARRAVDAHEGLLRDRLNAKAVRVTDEYEGLVRRVDPRMDVLGPTFGADAPAVADALRDAEEVPLRVGVDGREVEVTDEMVDEVDEPPEGVEAESFSAGTVYVDVRLTDSLRREGVYRDVLRRVQELRDELNVGMDDRVEVVVSADATVVSEAVAEHEGELRSEARADSVEVVDDADAEAVTEWSMEDGEVSVGVSRA